MHKLVVELCKILKYEAFVHPSNFAFLSPYYQLKAAILARKGTSSVWLMVVVSGAATP